MKSEIFRHYSVEKPKNWMEEKQLRYAVNMSKITMAETFTFYRVPGSGQRGVNKNQKQVYPRKNKV